MKKHTNLKKIGKKTFCLVLAAVLLFICSIKDFNSVYAGITVNENQQGYKWTRVENQKEYEELVARIQEKQFSKLDRNYNNDLNWTRAMLVWTDGSNTYFTSQGAGSSSDYWYGKTALSGYGIDVTQEVFYTRTGLDTPFIKTVVGGQDSRYEKENAVCFRLNEVGTEKMTKYVASCELSFFGIAYHAATRAQFTLYTMIDNKWNGDYKSHASANDDRLFSANLRFGKSWYDYFNDYGITEKQKNALLVAYEHQVYFKHSSNGGWTYDRHNVSQEEVMRELGYPDLDSLESINGTGYYDNSIGGYRLTLGYLYGKYRIEGYYTPEQRVAYAIEYCSQYPDLYDTSIFTKTYVTDKYKGGISGGDAFDKLFKSMCETYHYRDKSIGEGMAYLYYDFNGNICQRYWEIEGSRIDIDDVTLYCAGEFYLYLGEPYNTPRYDHSVTLDKGMTFFGNNTQIDNGIELTVPKGATLIIEGHVYNNGTIIVDGGTLIIIGVVDTDPKTVITGSDKVPINKLLIKNGGTCIISETGSFISRDDNSFIKVSGNSTLQVDGCILTTSLTVTQFSTLRASHGSAILVGVKAKSILSIDSYNATLLKNNKDTHINGIVDTCTASKSYFTLSYQSSFISDGLVYLYGNSLYGTGCAWSFWCETDGRRTINEGMKIW